MATRRRERAERKAAAQLIIKTLPHPDYLSRGLSVVYGWNWNKLPEWTRNVLRRNVEKCNQVLSREMAERPGLLRETNNAMETHK